MFKSATLAVLFAALAAAAPGQLDERGVNCAAVNTIVTVMKAQKIATPFCSSYLSIKETTTTSTLTSTPCAVTTTTTISSTDTVTSTSVVTTSSTTTVYPVVAVSTTSTCGLSQTVISDTTTPNQKRNNSPATKCTTYSPPPVGTPTCLTKFKPTALSSACSCLNIPTPTKVVFTTTTLSTSTVTSTVCSTAKTTTVTTVTTTSVSTYSGTQYYTSTFTVLPPPSSTINPPAAPTQSFGAYVGLDFNGNDLQSFNCYPGGPPVPSGFAECNNFNDCVNNCAVFTKNNAANNQTCGAVVYNAPADFKSGYCYLKTALYGCGSPNTMTNSSAILPLIAYDPQ